MSAQRLAKAEIAASKQSANESMDDAMVACPLKASTQNKDEKKERIEICVLGDADEGLAEIAVVLRKASGEQLNTITDDAGLCNFEGLDKGEYELCLPELDEASWELLKQISLGEKSISEATAIWKPENPIKQDEGFMHSIVQGECVAKLAARYGFFPENVWQRDENKALREQRVEMYILAPGDQLFIPPNTVKLAKINSSERIDLRRKGATEMLNIRFLDYDDTPRVNIPYLISVKADKNEALQDVQNQTDAGGCVRVAIPPNAVFVTIYLDKGPYQEVHEFNLGHVNPIDTLSGVKARLNNLGYSCGTEDQNLNDKTVSAIKAFQTRYELAVTGERDSETLKVLKEKFGS